MLAFAASYEFSCDKDVMLMMWRYGFLHSVISQPEIENVCFVFWLFFMS